MIIKSINMERESSTKKNNSISNNYNNNNNQPQHPRLGIGADTLRTRSSAISSSLNHETPDFVLQWGNKKRLRCMKIQNKEHSSDVANRTTARVNRRVIRTDLHQTGPLVPHQSSSSPRLLRNSENMRGLSSQGHGNNNGVVEIKKMHMQEGERTMPESFKCNNSDDAGFETSANEEGNKKGGGGGSSSGSEVIPPAVWPPKFVIALTNKEKEEDFMAIKGSKLPQRPKKRSKYVQRNLKLVSPGSWLCDLTLDRYEVREKKTSKKKRPRGLKAMCSTSIDSESE